MNPFSAEMGGYVDNQIVCRWVLQCIGYEGYSICNLQEGTNRKKSWTHTHKCKHFIEPTCAYARRAHMSRFASVCMWLDKKSRLEINSYREKYYLNHTWRFTVLLEANVHTCNMLFKRDLLGKWGWIGGVLWGCQNLRIPPAFLEKVIITRFWRSHKFTALVYQKLTLKKKQVSSCQRQVAFFYLFLHIQKELQCYC